METFSAWETFVSGALQLLTVLFMAWALFRWCFRLFRAAAAGDAQLTLPQDPGLERPPAGRALLFWVVAVLFLRALQYLLGYLMVCQRAGEWLPFESASTVFWQQWDAYHYLKLSQQGYVSVGDDRLMLVFFPLYPALISLFSSTGLSTFYAAMLVSLLASIGAVLALQYLVCPRYGRRAAHLACAYLLLNPLSVFMAAPYPEALFICLTLCAMTCAQRGRYLAAGLLGALSAFSRLLGLVVLGVILLEGYSLSLRQGKTAWWRRPAMRRALLGACIVPLGFLGYLLLNVYVSGAPFTFLEYQSQNWGQNFGSFQQSIATTARMLFAEGDLDDLLGTWLPQAILIPLSMLLLAARGRRLSLSHDAYSWVYLFLALAPTWLLSGPRYIMAMATLPILQAVAFKKPWIHKVSLVVQGLLLLLCLYAYGIRRMIL